MSDKIIDVAVVCIIRDRAAGREVVIARRPRGTPLEGLWEFPGGKLEAGESVAAAAHREVREEVDLRLRELTALTTLEHRYPHAVVRLHAFTARPGSDDEALASRARWVPIEALDEYDWPMANARIIEALRTDVAASAPSSA